MFMARVHLVFARGKWCSNDWHEDSGTSMTGGQAVNNTSTVCRVVSALLRLSTAAAPAMTASCADTVVESSLGYAVLDTHRLCGQQQRRRTIEDDGIFHWYVHCSERGAADISDSFVHREHLKRDDRLHAG